MNYIIEYTITSYNGSVLKKGKMRAKNKASEFEAKAKFGEWIKKRYPNCNKLIIHSCYEEGSIIDSFGDIFGSNPFGFK